MRTLFLIRHAKSCWGNPGLRDVNRPLNERGMHDAPAMAKMLVKRGVKPDLIVSSPAKRALTSLPYVYLGYWVRSSPKMDYKSRFRPLELLKPGGWVALDRIPPEEL